MPPKPPPMLTLTDREGDMLLVQSTSDTFWVEEPSDDGPLWAFDAAEVRKLRDACNAFLAGQGGS